MDADRLSYSLEAGDHLSANAKFHQLLSGPKAAVKHLLSSSISTLDSIILGVLEGLTEFIPVSSTGHLILAGEALGLDLGNPGVDAFFIVIQAGALVALAYHFRVTIAMMLRGLAGRSPEGMRLAGLLLIALVPAVVMGLALADAIKARLFAPVPVAVALAAGGVLMLFTGHIKAAADPQSEPADADSGTSLDIASFTWRMALIIGLAQCAALWPGVSRSMATIVGAMMVGLTVRQAAEFSFLLALPTLGGATIYDLMREGDHLADAVSFGALAAGLITACIVAAVAVKYFLRYLERHGLAIFGWYRLALAACIFIFWTV